MIQFTTPTIPLIVEAVIEDTADIIVSFKQEGHERVDVSDVEITEKGDDYTSIEVSLSQEQTGDFDITAPVEIQVNWIDSGKRDATVIYREPVFKNLLDEVK